MKQEEHWYRNITKADIKEYYKMSPLQKSAYLLWQTDKLGIEYNMPELFKIKGNMDINKLQDAFYKLVIRHEILRTTFYINSKEEYVQKIQTLIHPIIIFSKDKTSTEEELLSNFVKPFDLENEILVRLKLVERSKNTYFLIIDKHNIVSDGTSNRIFIRELIKIYNGQALTPVRFQYKDYSEWINSRNILTQKQFWLNMYQDEIPGLNMPLDYPRQQVLSFKGKTIRKSLEQEMWVKLKKIIDKQKISPYIIFLSVLSILLAKYSGEDTVVIGSDLDNRKQLELNNLVGRFTNTLPLICHIDVQEYYEDYLKNIKALCLSVYKNGEYPLEDLLESIGLKKQKNRNPFFDVILSIDDNSYGIESFTGTTFEYRNTMSKYDMMVTISNDVDSVEIKLDYNVKLYKKETAERFLEHYMEILKEISHDTNKKICEIEMITDKEKNQILYDFNKLSGIVEDNSTVIDLFENQVMRQPDKIAIVYENNKITYHQLNMKINHLAFKICEMGVKPEEFVAIYAQRSIEMIIGIYAIMKVGATYVPIDPTYPQERVQYILDDCGANIVLTYKTVIRWNVVSLPLEDIDNYDGFVKSRCKTDSTIYCIYTSGTTGKPKGVLIKNSGVVNLCKNCINKIYAYYNVQNVALLASYVFDASVQNIMTPLLSGRTLHIINDECRMDANKLMEYMIRNRIEGFDGTPMHLNMLNLDQLEQSKLRVAIIGGDVMNVGVNKKLLQKDGFNIYNVYGPTECTVDATSYHCSIQDQINIPIGKPIANTQIYIMADDKLCGIGVLGEICISGVGVAKGYLNQQELTEKKFVDNYFGLGKIYRTGDLGRWLPDGNIEYLGRKDEQIKIAGFRIELGEIVFALQNVNGVQECVVVAKEDTAGYKALHAYLVSNVTLDIKEVKNEISKFLPYYMVPNYIMQIDKIPLTANGKIDKLKLPVITLAIHKSICEAISEEEKILIKVFKQILKVDNIGVKSNIYEYGIDSMKLMKIVVKLRSQGYIIDYRTLVKYKCISDMALGMKKL